MAPAADGDPVEAPVSFGLGGRVVLITGGVRGVGAGISAVFAGQGAGGGDLRAPCRRSSAV